MTFEQSIENLFNELDLNRNIIEGLKEEKEGLIKTVKHQKVKINTLSHILNQYQMERLK